MSETVITTVSMPEELKEFAEEHGFSPSEIIQTELEERRQLLTGRGAAEA